MNLSKRKILMNAFFDSQFNYCPFVWMCTVKERHEKVIENLEI